MSRKNLTAFGGIHVVFFGGLCDLALTFVVTSRAGKRGRVGKEQTNQDIAVHPSMHREDIGMRHLLREPAFYPIFIL